MHRFFIFVLLFSSSFAVAQEANSLFQTKKFALSNGSNIFRGVKKSLSSQTADSPVSQPEPVLGTSPQKLGLAARSGSSVMATLFALKLTVTI